MATPTSSSILKFVKKYPITLCGFSLLFMPSVHRLLLYFTPLLLSTAIFILAVSTSGSSTTSPDQSNKRRGKKNEWAFNGRLKIYAEEEEEEEEDKVEEVEGVSQTRKEDFFIEGKTSNKLKKQTQEPDPDFDQESKCVETASTGAMFGGQEAEPNPALGGDGIGTVSNGAILGAQAGDLHGNQVGTASAAEPDPDLNGEPHVEAVQYDHNFSAAQHHLHVAPDHHHHHLHGHAKPAPKNLDKQISASNPLDYHDAEPDHVDYHDAANQFNYHDNYGGVEAIEGDDYHDAEPDPDLDGAAANAESEGAARIENDDLRAAIAELRQKLAGLVQSAPCSNVDDRDRMHSQIDKRLQTLQAAS